jgi:hypothetical protein
VSLHQVTEALGHTFVRQPLDVAAAGIRYLAVAFATDELHCTRTVFSHVREERERVASGNLEPYGPSLEDVVVIRQEPFHERAHDWVAVFLPGKGH